MKKRSVTKSSKQPNNAWHSTVWRDRLLQRQNEATYYSLLQPFVSPPLATATPLAWKSRPGPNAESNLSKARRESDITRIMGRIDACETNGRVPRGAIQRVVNSERLEGSDVTLRTIYCVRNRRNELSRPTVSSTVSHPDFTPCQSDTPTYPFHNDDSSFDSLTSGEVDFSLCHTIGAADVGVLPGRKKGSTNEIRLLSEQAQATLLDDISECWAKIRTNPDDNMRLWELISIKKGVYGMEDAVISEQTIYSRCLRGNVTLVHSGQQSPIADLEPTLCVLLKMASRMGQHVSQSCCIRLANELIADTQYESVVSEWMLNNNYWRQKRHNLDAANYPPPTLGWGWLRGFRKRYPEISAQYVTNAKHYRVSWATYSNLNDMYTLVYQKFVDWGIAKLLDKAEWQDASGSVVPEEEAMGMKVYHSMEYPDRVITMDETGDNGNQSDDTGKKGEKVMTEKGIQPSSGASTSDTRWTVQGWTTLSGKAVIGVIIIKKSSMLDWNETYGFDPEADWVGDGEDEFLTGTLPTTDQLSDNIGPGKRYPGIHTCVFNGKKIPGKVFATASGSVTPQVLVEVLKHLDKLNVFPRGNGIPNPTLLVDGHPSRVHPHFVQYINNIKTDFKVDTSADHYWNVAFGLPHGTQLWQVADQPEENQVFKYHARVKKDNLRLHQELMSETPMIRRHHVIPIFNYAFERSFLVPKFVKKACARCGWLPMNRNCLLDDGIQRTKLRENGKYCGGAGPRGINDRAHTLAEFQCIKQGPNFTDRFNWYGPMTNQVFFNVIQKMERLEAQDLSLRERRKEQKEKQTAMLDVMKKITTGNLYQNGIVSANDPALIESMTYKYKTRVHDDLMKECRVYVAERKIYDAGSDLYVQYRAQLEEGVDFVLTQAEYETLLRYKWLAVSENRPLVSTLKVRGNSKQQNMEHKKKLWNRWKQSIDPAPPIKPTGFDEYWEPDVKVERNNEPTIMADNSVTPAVFPYQVTQDDDKYGFNNENGRQDAM